MTGQGKPTKISFVYSNPTDPDAFETAYPDQIALARKLPGLTRLQTSKVWPKEDGSPTRRTDCWTCTSPTTRRPAPPPRRRAPLSPLPSSTPPEAS